MSGFDDPYLARRVSIVLGAFPGIERPALARLAFALMVQATAQESGDELTDDDILCANGMCSRLACELLIASGSTTRVSVRVQYDFDVDVAKEGRALLRPLRLGRFQKR